MKITTTLAVAFGLAALAACKQSPQENVADNIEANAENTADNIEANGANVADNVNDNAQNAADAVRNEGEAKAAIGPIVKMPVPTQAAVTATMSYGHGMPHLYSVLRRKPAESVRPQTVPPAIIRVIQAPLPRTPKTESISGPPISVPAFR